MPTNLLVKSEIIAVGAGAPFPARVRVLEPQAGEKSVYGQGEQFKNMTAGEANEASDILKGLNIAEARPLLKQMGHLRRFQLLETPFCLHLSSYLSENKVATDDDNETPYNLERDAGKILLHFPFAFLSIQFCYQLFALFCYCYQIRYYGGGSISNNTNATNIVVDVQFSHIPGHQLVCIHRVSLQTPSWNTGPGWCFFVLFFADYMDYKYGDSLILSLERSQLYTFYQRLKF